MATEVRGQSSDGFVRLTSLRKQEHVKIKKKKIGDVSAQSQARKIESCHLLRISDLHGLDSTQSVCRRRWNRMWI